MNFFVLTYRRASCLLNSIKSSLSGISWDGHCWDVSGDGEVRCIDCHTRAKPAKDWK